MKAKVHVEALSEETKKGLIATLEEIKAQNQQLIEDNKKFEAENEEFRQKLAEPRTVTEKIKAWWRS